MKNFLFIFIIFLVGCSSSTTPVDDGLDKPHPHPGINSHRHFAENIKGWFFK